MSTLDTQLAEMDRRLLEIQAQLAPEGESVRVQPSVEGQAPRSEGRARGDGEPLLGGEAAGARMLGAGGAEAERERAGGRAEGQPGRDDPLQAMAELSERLLASTRELLGGYEAVLARISALPRSATALAARQSMLGAGQRPPAQASGRVADERSRHAEGGSGPAERSTPAEGRSTPGTSEHGATVTVSVGPFGDTEAFREFERALSKVRGVREVDVRGFDRPDHAIIDVRLDE